MKLKRVLGRALGHVPPGAVLQRLGTRFGIPALDDEQIAVAAKTCLDVILDEASLPLLPSEREGDTARALASLQEAVDSVVIDPVTIERRMRACATWPAYHDELNERASQAKLLRTELAKFAWTAAKELVANDMQASLSWATYGGQQFCFRTMNHIGTLAITSLCKNLTPRGQLANARFGTMEYWQPQIRAGGGGKYFLHYAVATGLIVSLAVVGRVLLGSGTPDDFPHVADNQKLLDVLARTDNIWTPRSAYRVAVLLHMPRELRRAGLAEYLVRSNEFDETYAQAIAERDAIASEIRVLEKQTVTLRRRVEAGDSTIAQLTASSKALCESLAAAGAKAAARLPAAQDELEAYRADLRERGAQLSKATEMVKEAHSELARTREFLDVLLEPAPDALAPNHVTDVESDPTKWRIIFVGGHDRLHQKLRKQLRSATFIHQDQGQFSPEVFEKADAVVFSISYCNHALIYRAANEVRRRGLRAGYSNFSNTDIVLDEIRSILFGNAPAPLLRWRRSAASECCA